MIFDVEADGLLDVATKIHVLAYMKPDGTPAWTHDYDEMRTILLNAKVLIGHNIICYDIPLLEKILGIKIKARLIDTLALSWYLNHTRVIHGLDSYGKEYGIPKPKIDDWENLTIEEYTNRCVEDIKINQALWKDLRSKLLKIYENKKSADRLISYLSFKMDCLREQEESKWDLDIKLAKDSLEELLRQQDEKLPELIAHMPKVIKTAMRSRPAKPFKKDGSLSVQGVKWRSLLREKGLPEDYDGEVEVFVSEEEPNPNSHDQIKNWLFSLGWEPQTFKFVKDDNGERQIPQVRVDGDEGKELCPSVLELIPDNPAIGVLDGLTVIQHRISIFKGFLENHKNGKLVAGAAGFTNTLRLKHRVLVNLPGVHKAWGDKIRGCLVAPDGYTLCGSDMVSLEETTKKHYMFPYDPDFVEEMSRPGFDAHLDLAVHAKAVKQEEVDEFGLVKKKGKADDYVMSNWEADLFHRVTTIRKNYKAANYSCIYGVGAPKLSREIKVKLKDAKALIEAYWERNWSVRQLSEDTITKMVGKEMWLFNPVSRLWYSLRNQKDIFSTLNQGTGVFCFDSWIKEFRKVRPQLTGQFHDEVILCIKEGSEDKCTKLLKDAIKRVNDKLQLNVKLDIDTQYGKRYSDIH